MRQMFIFLSFTTLSDFQHSSLQGNWKFLEMYSRAVFFFRRSYEHFEFCYF